jgi:hypothetical protein
VTNDEFEALMRSVGITVTSSKPKGVWFVFGYDGNPYPAFVDDTEIEALRYVAKYNWYHVKFWEFGTEWSNER